MDEIAHKKNKIYYSIGEVAEMFDVNPSLIRFWEKKFDIIKPHKNKKGNRMFTPKDVDNFRLIYHLVKERGMTLAGAQKRLKENKEGAARNMEIVERLLNIRSMLVEIREELKKEGEIITPEGYLDEEYMQESAATLPATETAADDTANATELAATEEDDLIMITDDISTEIVTDGSSPWAEPEEDDRSVSKDNESQTMEERQNANYKFADQNDISTTHSEVVAYEATPQMAGAEPTTTDNVNISVETLTGLGNIFDDELDSNDEYADPWEEIDEGYTEVTVIEDTDNAPEGTTVSDQTDLFGTDACTTFSPDDTEAEENAEKEPQEPKRPPIYEHTLF